MITFLRSLKHSMMNSWKIKAGDEVMVKMVVKKLCEKTNWAPVYLLFTSKRSKELNERN